MKVPFQEVFGGGVDPSPSISQSINRVPPVLRGWQELAFGQADAFTLRRFSAISQKRGTLKTCSTSCSTNAGSQLTSYHWNTPKGFRPQSLLPGSPSPARRRWPHEHPVPVIPLLKGLGFSSQLTSDMWLTTLAFQNTEAKPSTNKVTAGPTPASLIEMCLLQMSEHRGQVAFWLQSRMGKEV